MTVARNLSQQSYQEACKWMPGGVNSPVRAFHGLEMTPIVVDYGMGEHIVDIDGNRYIDYCLSWGALMHGHAHPYIFAEVQKQVTRGSSFGALTQLEIKLAQKIIGHIPSLEKIRFVSSGTEATMSAIRLARGFTQKELIVKFNGNYHGAHDGFLVQAGSGVSLLSPSASSQGVPESIIKNTISLPYNDCEAIHRLFSSDSIRSKIAAVIIEPVAGNMGVVPATQEFIALLREVTKKAGALLIFDEVITGFRMGLSGGQGYYEIDPDLTCLGKIIGGGFPAGALGGKAEIMDHLAPIGPVYQAGTLSGNPIAMSAGIKSLELVEKEGFYPSMEKKTQFLINPIKEMLLEKEIDACVQHIGSMFTIFIGKKQISCFEDTKELDKEKYKQCYHFLFEQGLFFSPAQCEPNFISSAHTMLSLEKTRDLILEMIEEFLSKKSLLFL